MSEERRSTFEAGLFSVNSVSGVRDAQTGIYTGEFGVQPSDDEIAEMQFSAARAAAPVAGFRIYRDSTDDDASTPQFSISGGSVVYRGAVVTYAGTINVQLSGGDDVVHYVLLNLPAGTLTVNTTGWAATPHVRIATITPSGGVWTWAGVSEYRQQCVFRAAGELEGLCKPVLAKPTSDTLASTDNKSIVHNTGASALSVQTLPAAAAGMQFIFVVLDTDGLKIKAAAGDTIRVGASVSAAEGYIQCATVGASILLVALDDTQWIAVGTPAGTWTVDA